MCAKPSLSCPHCSRVLSATDWLPDGRTGSCRRCLSSIDFIPFPALEAAAVQANPDLQQLAAQEDEACCFFHRENKAEQVCSGCGRYLCSVCAVDFGGRTLCASCIEKEQLSGGAKAANERLLWDSLALLLAALPILVFPLIFLSFLTAPAAIGVAIVGFNKPCSLVRGKRTRLILALVLGILELAGWALFLTWTYLKGTGKAHP